MKRYIFTGLLLTCCLAAASAQSFRQQKEVDVVYLKDGGVLRGEITGKPAKVGKIRHIAATNFDAENLTIDGNRKGTRLHPAADMRSDLLPNTPAPPFVSANANYAASLNSAQGADSYFTLNPAVSMRFGHTAVRSFLSAGLQLHTKPDGSTLHFFVLHFGLIL
ncbi:MAG: hypothetical protein LBF67_09005 [Prevotellaceae bacterium]|nr:hypothetical protein [Prevotellaceae bacterium]